MAAPAFCQTGSCRGSVGKWRRPRLISRHTSKRAHRLLVPAALRTCPLASPRSHVRARLGPGGYCRRPGNGGPQTCLPAACGVAQAMVEMGICETLRIIFENDRFGNPGKTLAAATRPTPTEQITLESTAPKGQGFGRHPRGGMQIFVKAFKIRYTL